MNLSAKQIQALVRELVPVVAAKQKEQLESIKQEVKDECLTKVRNLGIPFNMVNGFVAGLSLNMRAIYESMQIKGSYSNFMTYESEEQVAENLYRNVIAQRFTEKFGKEITSNDIEHELIIGTIGADTVEQLINTVKAKLLK